MRIQAIHAANQTAHLQSVAIGTREISAGTMANFESAARILRILTDKTVRPKKVSRAKNLLADANFPSNETLEKISAMLAKSL
jgi:hypothetical protein